jgi:hypothetical protein
MKKQTKKVSKKDTYSSIVFIDGGMYCDTSDKFEDIVKSIKFALDCEFGSEDLEEGDINLFDPQIQKIRDAECLGPIIFIFKNNTLIRANINVISKVDFEITL